MAERRSALAQVWKPGHYGAEGTGVTFSERRPLSMVQIAAFDAAAAATAAGGALGIAPPARANAAALSGDTAILWTGPGRWLVVEPERRDLEAALRDVLPIEIAAVTDLSHSRTVFRMTGPAVRDLLSKGVTLDLDPEAFPAGSCAQTNLDQIGVLLHATAADSFDLYLYRRFAEALWGWLAESAAEYGYRVE